MFDLSILFMFSLVCEYLFTLVKAKDGRSVLKSCQGKVKRIGHMWQFLRSFILFSSIVLLAKF